MTKVVHLQTHLPSSGNAAYRLHNALSKAGISSSMLSVTSDINGNVLINKLGLKSKILTLLNGKIQTYLIGNSIKKYGFFSFPLLGNNIAKLKQVIDADIIYIHWAIGGFLNLGNYEQIFKLNKPVIIFMHDMWTITGGCHHSFECDKYKTGCFDCQIFENKRVVDLAKIEFNKKMKLFSKYDNICFVSPSEWLFNCAKQSLLTKNKPIYCIPNIIDNKFYKPFDKKIAKNILNIDTDAYVITFGAISVDNPYKGWKYIEKALEILKAKLVNHKIQILIFGSEYNKRIDEAIHYEVKFLGYLRDDYSTLLAYNATDIFLAPSIADNFPTTVMESMCCRASVVGFNIGGIPDMIDHMKNGYLAKYKDAEDLANGVIYCIENDIKGEMLDKFTPPKIIEMHLDLYKKLIQK